MLDLKAEVIRSANDGTRAEIAKLRITLEDLLATRQADDVMLTRFETHVVRFEVYEETIRAVLEAKP
jgi:hypothetical protein